MLELEIGLNETIWGEKEAWTGAAFWINSLFSFCPLPLSLSIDVKIPVCQPARCHVPQAAAVDRWLPAEDPWPPPAWAPLPLSASQTSTWSSPNWVTLTSRTNWTLYYRREAPLATGPPAPSPPSMRTRSRPPPGKSAVGLGWAREPKYCGCQRHLAPWTPCPHVPRCLPFLLLAHPLLPMLASCRERPSLVLPHSWI